MQGGAMRVTGQKEERDAALEDLFFAVTEGNEDGVSCALPEGNNLYRENAQKAGRNRG